MQEYSDTPLQFTSDQDGLDSLSDSIGVSQNAASPTENRISAGKESESGQGSGKLIELKDVPRTEVIKPAGIRFASKLEGMKLRSGTLLQRHSLPSNSSNSNNSPRITSQSNNHIDLTAPSLSTSKIGGHKPNFKDIIAAKKRASAIQQQHEASIDIPDAVEDDHSQEADAPFK